MDNSILQPKDRLLSAREVLEITGFKSRVTLWKKSRNDDDPFPRPFRDGTHYTRWKLSQIESWMDQLETV